MDHRVYARWSHLAVPLFFVCACSLPQHYENVAHPNYGAAEYGADLAQCRNRSVMTVVSTVGYDVHSGVGWTKKGSMLAWRFKDGIRHRPRSLG